MCIKRRDGHRPIRDNTSAITMPKRRDNRFFATTNFNRPHGSLYNACECCIKCLRRRESINGSLRP